MARKSRLIAATAIAAAAPVLGLGVGAILGRPTDDAGRVVLAVCECAWLPVLLFSSMLFLYTPVSPLDPGSGAAHAFAATLVRVAVWMLAFACGVFVGRDAALGAAAAWALVGAGCAGVFLSASLLARPRSPAATSAPPARSVRPGR